MSAPAPPAGTARPTTLPARWRRSAGTLPGSVLRVVLRAALVAGAALALAAAHDAHDPGVLCPLRLLTGVPCPVCGSTTVFVEAGHGRPGAALLANPVTALAALALVGRPFGPGRRRPLSYAGRNLLVGSALVAAWAWELVRLGPLRF
ncbi:DUF2752 domain-containing protein [Kitasatospora phosalacinea]|uniref:DUF2752 domain-containing protein n=1 Tax=Kitasatospora phosalacinea TaxID=2065 RepID=UPI000ADCF05B|nr:DUF2752 domain-containing protein [Kitasatospora phosalacinea]